MGRHRKRRTISPGRHRVVTPKRSGSLRISRGYGRKIVLALPLALLMALYPAIVRDGEGGFALLEEVIPVLREGTAEAGEVITDPTDPDEEPQEPDVDPPVVDLAEPLDEEN